MEVDGIPKPRALLAVTLMSSKVPAVRPVIVPVVVVIPVITADHDPEE
jgi:hypothetical protein